MHPLAIAFNKVSGTVPGRERLPDVHGRIRHGPHHCIRTGGRADGCRRNSGHQGNHQLAANVDPQFTKLLRPDGQHDNIAEVHQLLVVGLQSHAWLEGTDAGAVRDQQTVRPDEPAIEQRLGDSATEPAGAPDDAQSSILHRQSTPRMYRPRERKRRALFPRSRTFHKSGPARAAWVLCR
ncbi:hypothetical protein D3C78_1246840 [compost metagenome]